MKGIPEIPVVPLARVRGPAFWLRSAPATSGREARRCPRAVDERAARKARKFTAFGSVGGAIGGSITTTSQERNRGKLGFPIALWIVAAGGCV